MATKRNLKKGIVNVCGDIAGVCLFGEPAEKLDGQTTAQIIVELATIQEEYLKKVTLSYDKTKRDFETLKEFRAAKHKYYKLAYTTLVDQLNAELQQVLNKVNNPTTVAAE